MPSRLQNTYKQHSCALSHTVYLRVLLACILLQHSYALSHTLCVQEAIVCPFRLQYACKKQSCANFAYSMRASSTLMPSDICRLLRSAKFNCLDWGIDRIVNVNANCPHRHEKFWLNWPNISFKQLTLYTKNKTELIGVSFFLFVYNCSVWK